MKAFIVIVIVFVLGVVFYVQFVDKDFLNDLQDSAKKGSSNKYGMSEKSEIGTYDKLDAYLKGKLKFRKVEKPSKNGLTVYEYLNEHGQAERKEYVRSVTLYLDDGWNIKKIKAQTLFSFKRNAFLCAVSSFMEDYWKKLSGQKKTDWEGCVSMNDGGGDAYAKFSSDDVKGEYHWCTSGHPYRELEIEYIGTGKRAPSATVKKYSEIKKSSKTPTSSRNEINGARKYLNEKFAFNPDGEYEYKTPEEIKILYKKEIGRRISSAFPASKRTEVIKQADDKYKLINTGEKVTVNLRQGASFQNYTGEFKGFSGQKVKIGNKLILKIDLSLDILEMLAPETVEKCKREYIKIHWHKAKAGYVVKARKETLELIKNKYAYILRKKKWIKLKDYIDKSARKIVASPGGLSGYLERKQKKTN
jgi:hypothetical protein